MNEHDLKQIWERADNFTIQELNFECIKQTSDEMQRKLQTRIKKDILIAALSYVVCIPIFIKFKETLFFLPFTVMLWVWSLWETNRIYKLNSSFNKAEDIKAFLLSKKKLLINNVKWSRCLAYTGTPIIWGLFFFFSMSWEQFKESQPQFWGILLFLEIIVLVSTEIWIRKKYIPLIDEIRNLLQQLNDNNF